MYKVNSILIILLTALVSLCKAQPAHGQIAIPFTLNTGAYVTLVVEDKNGVRVRNLISETWFDAGKNIAWWDGLDDLGRDVNAAHHGVYTIPGQLVKAGNYTIRGLVHPEIKASYEFPIYSAGKTPWNTKDHTGGWLANHSAPQAAVFVPATQSPTKQPAVFLGSYVTEGLDGVAWVDLEGNKLGGKKWIGGAWTAAPYMSRDAGTKAAANIFVYVASAWVTDKRSGKIELRVSTIPKSDQPILRYDLGIQDNKTEEIGGIAVYNGVGVISLTKNNQLLFIDVKLGKVIGTATVTAPKGLAFDSSGHLLLISCTKILRYANLNDPRQPPVAEVVVSAGLEAPVGITIGTEGKIYVSDGGESHQVKVFSVNGKLLMEIGKPGAPKAGLYDPLHMNNPAGITIDAKQQLWVTENDFLPKRVSIWSLDGKLIKAFYGPAKYGGGGTLDPQDKSNFYYSEEGKGAMQFKIDWKTGESKLTQVIYRKTAADLELPTRNSGPETPLYYKGKKYFTNCFSSNPTGGAIAATLFVERNGIAYPAVVMGNATSWSVLKADPKIKQFFIWVDLNGDTKVQPAEVTYKAGSSGGVTVMADLSFCVANLNGTAMQFLPVSFTEKGIPVYQLAEGKVLATGVQPPGSTGGNQVLAGDNGWTVVTQGVKPFEGYSLSGVKNGKPMWSYPNLWPGLHASHEAPLPDFSGELIGPTRLLGNFLEIKGTDAGQLWAINSNHGMVYLFTSDGLFVSTLFEPMRSGKIWTMPTAQRGMSLKGLTLGEENFWPSLSQTVEGEVYLTDGDRSSVVKIEGLQGIKRLPLITVNVTDDDLKKSSLVGVKTASDLSKGVTNGILKVLADPILVNGKMDDWSKASWVDIDKRGVKAYFNAKTKPYDVTGAVSVSGKRLYVAYRTGDAALLKNSGEMPLAPFKTGGALDLMIGTDPLANPVRKVAVAGDLRLLVTIIRGKPKALLYRAVVSGTAANAKIPFSSPWRTITMDAVNDITSQIEFAAGNDGNFELSVPLSVLNLKPATGMTLRGDIGVLRGDGSQTLSRMYWNNKATSIVSDVPSEAELTPNLWGTWIFK